MGSWGSNPTWALLTSILVVTLSFPDTSASEVVDGKLEITFEPTSLELGFEDTGGFNVTVRNIHNVTLYVHVQHFRTKSPFGSSTTINPDELPLGPGETGDCRVTVISHADPKESGPRDSDVLLAFYWNETPRPIDMNDSAFWTYKYNIIDIDRPEPRPSVLYGIFLFLGLSGIITCIMLALEIVPWRRATKRPPGEKN